MKKALEKVFFSISAIITLFVIFSSVATPAHALSTYVWNNYKSAVPMQYAPTSAYNNVKVWIPNGTKFAMSCWEDFQWYYGNYNTNRWFWGQEYSGGYWGYVNASYVRNQTTVHHC